jgi:hypothetical protein
LCSIQQRQTLSALSGKTKIILQRKKRRNIKIFEQRNLMKLTDLPINSKSEELHTEFYAKIFYSTQQG